MPATSALRRYSLFILSCSTSSVTQYCFENVTQQRIVRTKVAIVIFQEFICLLVWRVHLLRSYSCVLAQSAAQVTVSSRSSTSRSSHCYLFAFIISLILPLLLHLFAVIAIVIYTFNATKTGHLFIFVKIDSSYYLYSYLFVLLSFPFKDFQKIYLGWTSAWFRSKKLPPLIDFVFL